MTSQTKPTQLGGHFGSFEHESLAMKINVTRSEVAELSTSSNRTVAKAPLDERLKHAMKQTACLHEIRHVVDCFGTIAGISLFEAYVDQLLGFVSACRRACKDIGRRWILHAANPENPLPSYLQKSLNNLAGLHSASLAFRTPFSPIVPPELVTDLVVQVPMDLMPTPLSHGRMLDPFTVAAAPISYAVCSTKGKPRKEFTALCPLGFESIIEGNATVIQRKMIEESYGDDVADLLMMAPEPPKQGRTFGSNSELCDIVRPYAVTDLLISKILASHGVKSFPREGVLQAADICLSVSKIIYQNKLGFMMNSPGDEFVDLVRQEWHAISKGTLQHPQKLTQQYISMLDRIDGVNTSPTESADPTDPFHALQIIKMYAFQKITRPLLISRIQTNHTAFTTYMGFLNLLPTLQGSYITVSADAIAFGTKFSEHVRTAWSLYVMLGALVRQLLYSDRLVLCPRKAGGGALGVEFCNFAITSDCAKEIMLGCGSFYEGRTKSLPECVFSMLLRGLGIS